MEISELQIVARIETGLTAERRYRCVVETGPGILPASEVGHPVWDIDVDAIDAGGRDLSHALHVERTPVLGIWTHPRILFAIFDPEGSLRIKNCGLAGNFALQPLRMVLGQRVLPICIFRDAFKTCDIDECLIAMPMRSGGYQANCFQFLFRIKQAFVSTRNVVVDFDAVNATGFCLTHNRVCIANRKWIGGDPYLP